MFETQTPQLYLDIDRTKAQLLGVNVADVFAALQVFIGSNYVNDFNLLGRTFRVTVQADAAYRSDYKDVLRIRARTPPDLPSRSAPSPPYATFRGRSGCRATISIRRPNSTGRRARLFAGPSDRDHELAGR